jgi:hypothetical protein
VVRAIEHKVREGDTRVILWLARRLRLADMNYPDVAPRVLVESPLAATKDATRAMAALEAPVEATLDSLARIEAQSEHAQHVAFVTGRTMCAASENIDFCTRVDDESKT